MENLENGHAFEELEETGADNAVGIVQPKKYESIVGMLFASNEEMFVFYEAYGK